MKKFVVSAGLAAALGFAFPAAANAVTLAPAVNVETGVQVELAHGYRIVMATPTGITATTHRRRARCIAIIIARSGRGGTGGPTWSSTTITASVRRFTTRRTRPTDLITAFARMTVPMSRSGSASARSPARSSSPSTDREGKPARGGSCPGRALLPCVRAASS